MSSSLKRIEIRKVPCLPVNQVKESSVPGLSSILIEFRALMCLGLFVLKQKKWEDATKVLMTHWNLEKHIDILSETNVFPSPQIDLCHLIRNKKGDRGSGVGIHLFIKWLNHCVAPAMPIASGYSCGQPG